MSTTQTPNLSLKKDNLDEPWVNLREHHNENMDAIDNVLVALTQQQIENAVNSAYSS